MSVTTVHIVDAAVTFPNHLRADVVRLDLQQLQRPGTPGNTLLDEEADVGNLRRMMPPVSELTAQLAAKMCCWLSAAPPRQLLCINTHTGRQQ